MPKRLYVGVDGKARKIKRMYVGVDGVAHKVKKGYIGVNGVARVFFAGGELVKWGTMTSTQVNTTNLFSASIGDYAIIGGGVGYSDDGYVSTKAVAINKTLTQTSMTFPYGRQGSGGANNDNYAIFAGGCFKEHTYWSNPMSAEVWAYDKNLTRKTATSLPIGNSSCVGTYFNGCAVFTAGTAETEDDASADIADWFVTYNNNLVRTRYDSYVMQAHQIESIGDYLFIGGGANVIYDRDGTANDVFRYGYETEVYNTSFVRVSILTITSDSRDNYCFAKIRADSEKETQKLLVAGRSQYTDGYTKWYDTVDVWNTSLVRGTPTKLSVARGRMKSTEIGDLAVFTGGNYNYYQYNDGGPTDFMQETAIVDAFDELLIRYTPEELSKTRYEHTAVTVGDYVLVAGGRTTQYGTSASTYTDIIDVYTLE